MSTATLIDRKITDSIPQNVIGLWEDTIGISASSDSTALIVLDLPGLVIDRNSYLQVPQTRFNGDCYGINLISFNISCLSTNFAASILNVNDISKIDTYNEILSYTSINKSNIDSDLGNLIIVNRDDPIASRLYLYISNSAVVATGSIFVELIYTLIQGRAF